MIAFALRGNDSPAGPRRALTSPHVHFALESQLDIIAAALGMDPLKIRLKNAARKGDTVAGGLTMPYDSVAKVIRTAADGAGWSPRRGAKRGSGAKARGIGIAGGHWTVWAGASSAWVHVNEDGTISVVTGAINLTGTNTSFAQIAAESFGVPVSRVNVHQGDTETSPRNDGSWGSRILFSVGEAVRRASEDAKRQLVEALAEELEASPDDIEVSGGRVRAKGKSLTLAEAAERASEYRGAIIGRGALSDLDYGVAVAAQVAEVEVDRETGQVELKRLICAQDVGFAINPMSVEGQIEGAASQGIGYALSEEYVYDGEGRLLNDNFMDFRMPTSLDHPQFDIALLEERKDKGPYGAKGVGEPPLVPTAAAIANAIYDAVGVRLRQLPMTPERIVQGMRRGRGRRAQGGCGRAGGGRGATVRRAEARHALRRLDDHRVRHLGAGGRRRRAHRGRDRAGLRGGRGRPRRPRGPGGDQPRSRGRHGLVGEGRRGGASGEVAEVRHRSGRSATPLRGYTLPACSCIWARSPPS